jgi:hypothetical protein
VPLRTLEKEWRQMIGTIDLPPGASEAQRERFRGGSVFARPCPHAIAARRERAVRALVGGDRAEAVALLREVCADSPGEPRHQLELADVLRAGDVREHQEAAAIWLSLAGDAARVTSSLRVEVLERLAREAAVRGERAAVEAWIALAASLPVEGNERRQVEAEQLALTHRGPAATPLYSYFFLTGPLDTATLAQLAVSAEPELGFAHYLLGLQRLGQSNWAEAASELSNALVLGLPDTLFVRNAARRLAAAAYRAHDRAGIERALAILGGDDMPTPDRLLAKDWQERLAFDAKRS